MRRGQLPWLVALPLAIAGSFAARWATQVCVSPPGGETGNESAEHLHRAAAQGGHWALVVGLLAGSVVVGVAAQVAAVVRQRPLRSFPASLFFCLPPAAFLAQEIFERASGAEPLHRLVGSQLALGLALQIPFALLAYASARLLTRVAERLGSRLAARAFTRRQARTSFRSTPRRVELPRIAALATGYGERGPPLRA